MLKEIFYNTTIMHFELSTLCLFCFDVLTVTRYNLHYAHNLHMYTHVSNVYMYVQSLVRLRVITCIRIEYIKMYLKLYI
jgi:hypothetical protein